MTLCIATGTIGVIIHTAIFLLPPLTEVSLGSEKDIMEGQRFESPTAPYFDEGEIAWNSGRKINCLYN